MAYKVIILYRLYMPSYVLGTFTEYPKIKKLQAIQPKLAYLNRFTRVKRSLHLNGNNVSQ